MCFRDEVKYSLTYLGIVCILKGCYHVSAIMQTDTLVKRKITSSKTLIIPHTIFRSNISPKNKLEYITTERYKNDLCHVRNLYIILFIFMLNRQAAAYVP